MESAELRVRRVIARLYDPSVDPSADMLSRPLVATPFQGNYGRAGWVIAVNGSPPRGVVTVLGGDAFFISSGRSKRITREPQLAAIFAFLKTLEE